MCAKPKDKKIAKAKSSEPDLMSTDNDATTSDTNITPSGKIDVMHNVLHISGMFRNWFLDYASYVILERAVPNFMDGLKPVQRRILHAMYKMDDGRYNKVANIIGYTMQYHPHGDASIGDALVQLGQKDLLIDTQGNWGNILTGDDAAAPRYIEARFTKFAQEVVFNPKTTDWKLTYDGRNKEPIVLPAKFPLLLAMGSEGIAVGLASKILPHNFNELIDASIAYLRKKSFVLYPDFPTGGFMDVSKYNDGQRSGSVKVRAKITIVDKKTLAITELPFGKTTSTLIETIIKANDKGKIKIRKIDDNTSENVEILVHLIPGTSPDMTIDALYAFTDCEIPISINSCVIDGNTPIFTNTTELLKKSVDNTLMLLGLELKIALEEYEQAWHMSSLEKIFIEKKIYQDIEECETWEEIIEAIDNGLKPYKKKFRRPVTREDIERLTEIKIKRISKFDVKKADQIIKDIEKNIEEVKTKLSNITAFAINYYQEIKRKYGTGRDRKTEIRGFEAIQASDVVMNNAKLYVNRAEGFVGTDLKKEEFVCDCSDIDDVIAFTADGTFKLFKVTDKFFVGKEIIYLSIFRKNDERTTYNVIYRDGINGNIMVKRCPITGLIRDKEYFITKGTKSSRLLYFSVNPNAETEKVKVFLKPRPRMKTTFEFDFSTLEIKGRNAIGNILSRYAVHKVETLGHNESVEYKEKRWFDESTQRLNTEERGKYIGEFFEEEKIIVISKNGEYRLTGIDLSTQFTNDDIAIIEKFDPIKVYSVVYYDITDKSYYLKRFVLEGTNMRQRFLDDDATLVLITDTKFPSIEIEYSSSKLENEFVDGEEWTPVRGYKAKGNMITDQKVKRIFETNPLKKKEATNPFPKADEPDENMWDPSKAIGKEQSLF